MKQSYTAFLAITFYLLVSLFQFNGPMASEPFDDVPSRTGWITDQAGLLSPETRGRGEKLLEQLAKEGSAQVAVLIIPTLGGRSLEQFSLSVAETWGIGDEDRDNGVLLFIAVQERKIRIEVGYGVEDSLTDLISGRIIRSIIAPEFRKREFDRGVLKGVLAIAEVVSGNNDKAQKSRGRNTMDPAAFLVAALFGFFFVGVLFKNNTTIAAFGGLLYGIVLGLFAPYGKSVLFSIWTVGAFGAFAGYVAAKVFGLRGRRNRSGTKKPGNHGYYSSENTPDHPTEGGKKGGDFGGGGASDEW